MAFLASTVLSLWPGSSGVLLLLLLLLPSLGRGFVVVSQTPSYRRTPAFRGPSCSRRTDLVDSGAVIALRVARVPPKPPSQPRHRRRSADHDAEGEKRRRRQLSDGKDKQQPLIAEGNAAVAESRNRRQHRPVGRGSSVRARRGISSKKKPATDEEDRVFGERVEQQLALALNSLRTKGSDSSNSTTVVDVFLFPTVRECNRALAIFGRTDLLRALRLFGKMRRASAIAPSDSFVQVPTPTLVTYSTLMARAVQNSKPRVALRLWKLMQSTTIVPDVRAANILMNCYAKLAQVDRAQDLLEQMRTGNGPDIHIPLDANLVTHNTVLDACLKAGDLDAALLAKDQLLESGIKPDARTYTNLIATVARQPSQSAGQNDPTLAFLFLKEMRQHPGLQPNGMTYSALIDACGRCKRSDLALQGLRMLLKQKNDDGNEKLENEVGAWTAAIKACGTAGRIDTAIRLFETMPNFGVEPNTVTCGCLTDVLLKAGRTSETLKVLRYMKANGVVPSEVMYTSLMTRAERLVQLENDPGHNLRSRSYSDGRLPLADAPLDDDDLLSSDAKAIEVYTELMMSLMDIGRDKGGRRLAAKTHHRHSAPSMTTVKDSNTLLVKVFLVFQQMKDAGAEPDLACYNALLKACARAGDVSRGQRVLQQIQASGLHPNDASWRHLLQAASAARDGNLALEIWSQGMEYQPRQQQLKASISSLVDEPLTQWNPSVESFAALLIAFLREASSKYGKDGLSLTSEKRASCYTECVALYDKLLLGDVETGLDRIDPIHVLDSQRTMLLILQAIVALEQTIHSNIAEGSLEADSPQSREDLISMASSILELECFQQVELNRLSWASAQAYHKALAWKGGA